ncbi:MAG: hypothetical protein ACI8UO_005084 [Verrucomicrobiales bacterium]|jgi:uncharacterized protein (DUF1501 family)
MKDQLKKMDPLSRRAFAERTAKTALGLSLLPAANSLVAAGAGKAKHVIYLYMAGGMTHLDTFDPKPGADTQGQTPAIETGVPGIKISGYMPKVAERFNDVALIRGFTQKTGSHGAGSYWMQTGFNESASMKHPNMGAWAQKLLGKQHPQIPDTVYIGGGAQPNGGFLGPAYSPLPIGNASGGLPNSKPPVPEGRFETRMDALAGLNESFLKKYETDDVKAYKEFYDNTIEFLSGDELSVFDLSKETKAKRDAYGNGGFGQGLLLARRLVGSGVRFVKVTNGGWDMHGDLWNRAPQSIGQIDAGIGALIDDLKAEGLFDSTLIVLTTEFGRTPKINARGGRDHYPRAFSGMMAGGGILGGQAFGTTDARGIGIEKDPCPPEDFNATIAEALGLPRDKRTFAPNGRPFLVANEGTPIQQFFG